MKHELLEIECGTSRLTIVGELPPLPPGVETAATARIRVEATAPLTVKAWNDPTRELVVVAVPTAILPLFFEFGDYDFYWLSPQGWRVESEYPGALALHRTIRDSTDALVEHYRLTLRNDVGFFRFQITTPRAIVVAVCDLEVYPRKLDYHRDYLAITADLSRIAHNLIFAALARTSVVGGLVESQRGTMVEWFKILERLFGQLLEVLDAIQRDPLRRLEPVAVTVRTERVRRVSREAINRALRDPKELRLASPSEPGLTVGPDRLWFKRLQERRHTGDYDVHENRFLRWLLSTAYSRLARIRFGLSVDLEIEDVGGAAWRAFADRWRALAGRMMPEIQRRLAYDFLAEVGETDAASQSVALQAHPLYSKAFQIAQALLKGLHVGMLEFTMIGSKPIWLLYEYWCYLAILEQLAQDAELLQTNVIQVDFQGSRVALVKGVESAVEFRHRRTGQSFRVIYNRLYPTPTVWQRPDTAVHIETGDSLYVFDAKYRLQFDAEYVDTYGGVGPHVDDVNTMHRYRDSIVNLAIVGYPRIVRTATVLFPFADEEPYRAHRFFRSIDQVGVGGLPFLPGARQLVGERLRMITENVPANAGKGA